MSYSKQDKKNSLLFVDVGYVQNKNILAVAISAAVMGLAGCNSDDSSSTTAPPSNLVNYVDTTIGTGGLGNTYPGATVPHGMVQLSPDNGQSGWDYIGGYYYYDELMQMVGFSHTHLSGTGAGDMYDLRIMPINSRSSLLRGNKEASEFDHDNETATAGYYQVYLEDYGINAELTTTERVGFHRYEFPENNQSEIVIDPGFTMNWDVPTETYIKIVDEYTIEGHRYSTGWAADQREHFVIKTSKPFTNHRLFEYSFGEDGQMIPGDEVKNNYTRAYLEFDTSADLTDVELKVALSSVSVEGAYKNLEAEAADLNFDSAHQQAAQRWEAELEKFVIPTTGDEYNEEKRIFYTSVYHSLLGPTLHSDVDGYYKGADHTIQKAEGFDRYDTFSLWDTFRAAHPLYTIIEPTRVNDMIKSMLAHYDETGKLPVWSLKGNETDMMLGYHSAPVIADAILKDIGDFDYERAYEALKTTAMSDLPGMDEYLEKGFVPYSDEEDGDEWAASRTLEYAYDDWSVALVAKKLGKDDDFGYFMERSEYWRNQFDEDRNWFVPRLADGSFILDFDPEEHERGFSESNAWQYFASVNHDIGGLIDVMGGADVFEDRLDEMFTTEPSDPDDLPIFSTGMVGLYVQGNEPAHHVPYLFNYVGAPWKTQQWLSEINDVCYNDKPEGICGNEDYGQMSAWYIFGALGFYPMNPANGIYAIGKPVFPETTVNLENGNTFTVIANNISEENIFIQSAKLNGETLDRSFINHDDIMNGGVLEFDMYNEPNKDWASTPEAMPPSGIPEDL